MLGRDEKIGEQPWCGGKPVQKLRGAVSGTGGCVAGEDGLPRRVCGKNPAGFSAAEFCTHPLCVPEFCRLPDALGIEFIWPPFQPHSVWSVLQHS